MKKWLKRHGRWVVLCGVVLLLANAIYGITRSFEPGREVMLIAHTFGACLWLCILLMLTGGLEKIYRWWDKG